MLESTFLGDWDEIGTKMAKKGHLLPKSGINSELVSIQRVNPALTPITFYINIIYFILINPSSSRSTSGSLEE